jgi:hypothetical protein
LGCILVPPVLVREELDTVFVVPCWRPAKFDKELDGCAGENDPTDDIDCLFMGSRDGKALIFKSGVIARELIPSCPADD